MITDTQQFIATMAARGVLRFAPPVAKAEDNLSRRDKWTLRNERVRRAAGRRIYAQPFAGKLPSRSDPSYRAVYMRLARGAGKWKGTKV